MQPQNRLRSAASSVICSRCTSVLSVNHSRVASRCTSQLSLHHINRKSSKNSEPMVLCKICLVDYSPKETYKIQQCHCVFCKEVFTFLFSFSSTEKLSFSIPNVPQGSNGNQEFIFFTLSTYQGTFSKDVLFLI